MALQIDNRRGSAELAKYISVPYELTRMDFADFCFVGNGPDGPVNIGIERKTIRDLLSSINTGRLSGHQLIGLANSYDYIYIVVDGAFKAKSDGLLRVPCGQGNWTTLKLGDRPVHKSMIDNYFNNLFAVLGISHEFTNSPMQTGMWVSATYKWWNKKWTEHKAHLDFHVTKPRRVMMSKPTTLHRMIKEIEGVGWDKGLVVSRAFNSMAEIVMAEEKDISKGRGIGKILAKRILNTLWGRE
jgi:ERCC4-type nuclease